MSKINEVLSKRDGGMIEIEGIKIFYDRFNCNVWVRLSDQGVDIDNLQESLKEKSMQKFILISWELMKRESKTIFEDNISNYMELLTIEYLPKIQELILNNINNSLPVNKENNLGDDSEKKIVNQTGDK